MYQNKYPKMIISIGIYNINRPQYKQTRSGVRVGGGLRIYIYIYIYMIMFI